MKKKQLAVWIMTAALSAAMMTGCGQKDAAEQTENTEQAENTEDQTAGSEEATMPDEDMEMDPEFGVDSEETSAAVFGVITDVGENEIIVDNQSGVSSEGEIILMIDPDHTYLLDASTGLPVDVKDVQAGDSFEAYLGDAMTLSLPPQNTPDIVFVNVPEDIAMPAYAVAAEDPTETNGIWTLKATDGTVYEVTEDAQVVPYLTKNIVKMQDVQKGTACAIWYDDQNQVQKVMILE